MPDLPTTKAGIEKIEPPATNAVDYRDTKQRALWLRVSPAGTKSWCVRYKKNGRSQRANIGRFPELPISFARDKAADLLAMISKGGDPVADKKADRVREERERLETVEAIGREYLDAAKVGRHKLNGRPKKPHTVKVETSYFERIIVPEFGKRRLADLTRAEIQAAVNRVADEMAPGAARHTRSTLQRIYAYALWREIVEVDPTRFVSAPTWIERDRVLTDVELKTIWKGLGETETFEDLHISPAVSIALKLAAVTLQRRAEVAGISEDEIDRQAKIWTIPSTRTKNGRTHIVPLSDLALDLIDDALALRPKSAQESPMVFPSPRDPEKPIGAMAMTHAWRRLIPHLSVPAPTPKNPDREKPIENVVPHDLRRTGATSLTSERLGFDRFVVSRVLNHASDTGGTAAVTAVYDRNAYMPAKRRALDAWADLLLEIVEGKERPTNVVPMAG